MIIRTPKDRNNPYAMISKFALRDPSLSWQAKGLLAYLLSLPDDWQVLAKELVQHAKNGKNAVYSIIRELLAAGYIKREQKRNKDSRFQQVTYTILEYPAHVYVISNGPASQKPGCGKINAYEEAKFKAGERGNYDDLAHRGGVHHESK